MTEFFEVDSMIEGIDDVLYLVDYEGNVGGADGDCGEDVAFCRLLRCASKSLNEARLKCVEARAMLPEYKYP